MGGGGGVPREGRRKTGHTKYRWRLHGYAGPALPVALALSLALDKETLLVRLWHRRLMLTELPVRRASRAPAPSSSQQAEGVPLGLLSLTQRARRSSEEHRLTGPTPSSVTTEGLVSLTDSKILSQLLSAH